MEGRVAAPSDRSGATAAASGCLFDAGLPYFSVSFSSMRRLRRSSFSEMPVVSG